MTSGDEDASRDPSELLASMYDELRRLAGAQLRQQDDGHTLQATALVNEAYLKLADQEGLDIRSPGDFAGLAATVMRNVLVDHARAKHAAKRGAGWRRVTLGAADGGRGEGALDEVDVLALDEALSELSDLDPRMSRLIELRFFGGLSEADAAEALGVSRSSLTRDWRMARAWLAHRMGADEAAP